MQAGPHTIILDAGTGIINLGAELTRRARANGNKPIVATIFFSHMHHDHTQGFPFFDPAYLETLKQVNDLPLNLPESVRRIGASPHWREILSNAATAEHLGK